MRRFLVLMAALLLFMCFAMPVFAAGANQSSGPVRIEMYNKAANYSGIQQGWFAQIIKDKFNIELNIIAPQVSGEALFQTRSAAGNLGDLILLGNDEFADSMRAGLIKDISGEIKKYPNLMTWWEQIEAFNKALPNTGTRVYGIPCEMTNTSPTTYSQLDVYISPWLPWDLFTAAGAPRLRTTNDLLDVLEAMQKANPRGVDGLPAYAIGLWPDWDVTSVEPVNQVLKWYGAEVASGDPTSSILLDYQNRVKPLTDDNGEYLKALRFFFDANQRGIVDPDSPTQNWDQFVTKMQNRRVYLWWYSWQKGFWNNTERGNARQNFIPIPVEEMKHFQDGDSYFGINRTFGVGTHVDSVKYEKIMQFLDWLASPEGAQVLHASIQGWYYRVLPDGTYELTANGENAWADETLRVPAEYGGGVWLRGKSEINQYIVAGVSTNPVTKAPYTSDLWPATLRNSLTTTQREWNAKYNATSMVDYLTKNNQIGVVPYVNFARPSDPTDMALIRSQCSTIVRDTSWRMMFARDLNEFNSLWNNMKTQLNGLGWQRLVDYDTQVFQFVVNSRRQSMR